MFALSLTMLLGCAISTGAQVLPNHAGPDGPTPIHIINKGPVPANYFGINIAGVAAAKSWPRLPAVTVRVGDSAWWRVEPQKGTFDFSNLDRDVQEAEQHHADLELILYTSPTWASARPTESGVEHAPPGERAEAANISDWQNYVRTVATRYKGRVHTYELWNEANTKGFYTGDVPTLVKLCAAAYQELKQIDPTITVISPSPAPNNTSFPFLREFFTDGGLSTFDVLGYHFYDNLSNPRINPELVVGVADHIRVLLSQFHASKPIWNTESGWYIQSGPAAMHIWKTFPNGVRPIDQDEAAAAVARSFVLAWPLGVDRFNWYAWAEPAYALVDDMGATDKPATVAYRTVARWLLGATYRSITKYPDGTWLVAITRANGEAAWIVWSTKMDTTFTLPADVRISQAVDLNGTVQSIGSRDISITALPLLLR